MSQSNPAKTFSKLINKIQEQEQQGPNYKQAKQAKEKKKIDKPEENEPTFLELFETHIV